MAALAIPPLAVIVATATIMALGGAAIHGTLPHEALADGMHGHLYEWGSYGIGPVTNLVHPQFIDADSDGNVYVTDLGNKRVQKFDAYGGFLATWGKHGSANGQFSYPSGIATDGDFVYVADRDLNKVQKFDTGGNYISQWGKHGKSDGRLAMPNGVAVSGDGHVYVADTGNYRVQKFTTEGEFVASFGESGTGKGEFVTPHDVEVAPDGSVYVSDRGNKRIDRFAANGTHIESHKFDAPGSFDFVPEGIAIAPGGAMIYVVNAHSQRVLYLSLNASSEPLGVFEKLGPIRMDLVFPTDVLFGADGQLYVADSLDHSIHAFRTPYYASPGDGAAQPQNGTGAGSHVWNEAGTDTQAGSPSPPGTTAQPQEHADQQSDTEPPIITIPGYIIVEATGMRTAVDIGVAHASDQSGAITITTDAPETYPVGVTRVTWTATDGAGNSASAHQHVIVMACGMPPSGYNVITGTEHDDVINGTSGNDLIFGQAGRDLMFGEGGNDCMFGEGGNDVMIGGPGNDHMFGGSGDDILRGEDGSDRIYGGTGADLLDGGDGPGDYCDQVDGLDLLVHCEAYHDDASPGATGRH